MALFFYLILNLYLHVTHSYCIMKVTYFSQNHTFMRTKMDYQEYEKQCNKIRKDNEEYLSLFEEDLNKSGLMEKTIRRHLNNVDFYLNEFLLREEPLPMERGMSYLDSFLGDFFIRKCMWSTPANIKSTAASIKKFYRSMLDHKKVDPADYKQLCDEIKDRLAFWQAACKQYNDCDSPNPFFFF